MSVDRISCNTLQARFKRKRHKGRFHWDNINEDIALINKKGDK